MENYKVEVTEESKSITDYFLKNSGVQRRQGLSVSSVQDGDYLVFVNSTCNYSRRHSPNAKKVNEISLAEFIAKEQIPFFVRPNNENRSAINHYFTDIIRKNELEMNFETNSKYGYTYKKPHIHLKSQLTRDHILISEELFLQVHLIAAGKLIGKYTKESKNTASDIRYPDVGDIFLTKNSNLYLITGENANYYLVKTLIISNKRCNKSGTYDKEVLTDEFKSKKSSILTNRKDDVKLTIRPQRGETFVNSNGNEKTIVEITKKYIRLNPSSPGYKGQTIKLEHFKERISTAYYSHYTINPKNKKEDEITRINQTGRNRASKGRAVKIQGEESRITSASRLTGNSIRIGRVKARTKRITIKGRPFNC